MQTDIMERLQEVYKLDEQDAAALVKIYEEVGDVENLKKAQADHEKWKEKLRKHNL